MSRADSFASPLPGLAPSRPAAAERHLHPVVIITILTLITPMYFSIGEVLLTPSRLWFLVLVPILGIQLLSGKYGKTVFLDYAVVFKIIWMAVCTAVHLPSVLVTFIGSQAVVILGGYLAARCFIRTPEQFMAMARFLGIIILVFVPLALIESMSSDLIIPPILDAVPGVESHRDVDYEPRFGLDRAQVVFSHPIHWGLFASLSFSVVLIANRNKISAMLRVPWSALIIIGVFFSVSSGPFLATLLQGALLLYNRIFQALAIRWKLMIYGGGGLYMLLEVLSDRPAYFVILEQMAFNSHTAGVRRTLLEMGTAQVMRTPLLGTGFTSSWLPTWMTGSLDNYWLATALNYGLPAFTALASGLLITMFFVGRRRFALNSDAANCKFAWMVLMVSLGFTLATVAIWSEMMSAIYFMFGAGVWLLFYPGQEDGGEETVSEGPVDTAPARTPYSRFAPRRARATSSPANPTSPYTRF